MAGLLAESFEMLAREVPAAHERTCRRLSGRVVEIQVDKERFVVEFDVAAIRVRPLRSEDDALERTAIVTTKQAIFDVIEARRSIADAVLSDQVEAVATLDQLVEVSAGLSTYVHGAVRCPSFPRLLERFRRLSGGVADDVTAMKRRRAE